jgi:hypothetical protein
MRPVHRFRTIHFERTDMTTSNPKAKRGHYRRGGLLHPGLLILILLTAVTVFSGCEINKPEMPTFETALTIPLGVERVEILDVIEDEDFLVIGDDGGLSFFIDGDPDTMAFDFELSADIGSQTIDQGLGNFSLEALDPMNYSFELGQIWAPADGVVNLLTIVPAFPIDVLSAAQDIPDVDSATLTSGSITITLNNGLPVPVSADSGPDQLFLTLEDPGTGAVIATFVFPEVAGGSSNVQTVDLAGATLPGSVSVRMLGGSPGSGGQVVTVNGTDSIDIEAQFTDMVVSSAQAVVGAQTFQTSFETELPADYEMQSAVISSGSVVLDVNNNMPVPCVAVMTWHELMDLGDQPLSVTFNLDAGQTQSRTVDFAGYILTAGGAPLTALVANVDITTNGSEGSSVLLTADDGLTADLLGGTIAFSSVTGLVPDYNVAIDPIMESIDLPAEMDGLQLVAASMVMHVTNSAGLPANLALTMEGTSAAGHTVTMDVTESIMAAQDRATTTDIVLDETNSSILDFLNNLPVSITLAGDVIVGGDGVVGTVSVDDFAVISWDIHAPVEVIITGTTLDTDPSSLDLDQDMRDMIRDHALGAYIQTEIQNHLPVAVELFIKAGTDTSTLATAPLLEIGPLIVDAALVDPITHIVTQSVLSMPTVDLSAEDALVFSQPDLHTLIEVRLPSSEGNPVRMMSTDYLEVRGIIQMDVNVNDQW